MRMILNSRVLKAHHPGQNQTRRERGDHKHQNSPPHLPANRCFDGSHERPGRRLDARGGGVSDRIEHDEIIDRRVEVRQIEPIAHLGTPAHG